MSRVLIVDDKENIREVLKDILESRGLNVLCASDVMEALQILADNTLDIVLTDINMPGRSGLDLLGDINKNFKNLPVIMLTAYGSIDSAVKAMKLGAYDYITKPIDYEYLLLMINRALENRDVIQENRKLKEEIKELRPGGLIGDSPAFKRILTLVDTVAPRDSGVLIQGECGTGKELVAREIHNKSNRDSYVVVDCASLPEDLLESELFGYEKGAFTGAITGKKGRIELADNGTLFLDEIGELSGKLQAKLLRVIQEREFTPLGGLKAKKVDFRLVAATNKDLKAEVDSGSFRSDLYYRLNVVNLKLPPLRDRLDDIPILAMHFLDKVCNKENLDNKIVSREVLHILNSYNWPGNVRELENVIERMVIVTSGNTITRDCVPDDILDSKESSIEDNFHLDKMERRAILKALDATKWNKSEAAKLLNIGRKALYNKLDKYNIN